MYIARNADNHTKLASSKPCTPKTQIYTTHTTHTNECDFQEVRTNYIQVCRVHGQVACRSCSSREISGKALAGGGRHLEESGSRRAQVAEIPKPIKPQPPSPPAHSVMPHPVSSAAPALVGAMIISTVPRNHNHNHARHLRVSAPGGTAATGHASARPSCGNLSVPGDAPAHKPVKLSGAAPPPSFGSATNPEQNTDAHVLCASPHPR